MATVPEHFQDKVVRRRAFLEKCAATTAEIHLPIADIYATDGFLNPAGLGEADGASGPPGFGQSSVVFESMAEEHRADSTNQSPYDGGAEYGIVRTGVSAELCAKMAALHGGAGAIVCPSGLAAITVALQAFPITSIAVPDTVYWPVRRYLKWVNRDAPTVHVKFYSGAADAHEMQRLLETAAQAGHPIDLIYLEAPGGGTFEVPDIAGIVALAKSSRIPTMIDNTWATHARFKPVAAGIDIVIQATTKYEGGYGDTPSGVVIAASQANFQRLSFASRTLGVGAVAPQTCRRLLHRLDSMEARLNQQTVSAIEVMDWLEAQPFVDRFLCPARSNSPDYPRFSQYFSGGNGLFTIVFAAGVDQAAMERFVDALLLHRIAASWGGHVSLVLPVHATREITPVPAGQMLRVSIGLEDADDLIRDLKQAARVFA